MYLPFLDPSPLVGSRPLPEGRLHRSRVSEPSFVEKISRSNSSSPCLWAWGKTIHLVLVLPWICKNPHGPCGVDLLLQEGIAMTSLVIHVFLLLCFTLISL